MKGMTLAALIQDAKRVYAFLGLDCGHGLLPPAKTKAVNALASELTVQLPEELRALYGVHGGQEYIPPGISGLFGQHRLHTPEEVVEHHRMLCEYCLRDPVPAFPPASNEWGYWVPQLLPFASWDAYDLCIHCDTGEVWEFIPNTGLIRNRPSIAFVLREVLAVACLDGDAKLGAMRTTS